jgi:uncharacterized Zn finger protein (UPF0148 family)
VQCQDCGTELPERTGRGRPAVRCATCQREHRKASRRIDAKPPLKPESERPGNVEQAARRELDGMPAELRDGAVAMAVLELARSIDLGAYSFRFQSGLVSELRDAMKELRDKAPSEERDPLDDLAARRAARRGSAAANQ